MVGVPRLSVDIDCVDEFHCPNDYGDIGPGVGRSLCSCPLYLPFVFCGCGITNELYELYFGNRRQIEGSYYGTRHIEGQQSQEQAGALSEQAGALPEQAGKLPEQAGALPEQAGALSDWVGAMF